MTNNAWNTPTMDSVGDGYTLIGSGAGRPAAGLITGDSNVTITPGANTLEVSSSVTAGAMTKIGTATASASASISFTGLSSTYFLYILRFSDLQPATDATTLLFRTSTDNGSTYDSGASDYAWNSIGTNDGGTFDPEGSAGDTKISLIGDQSSEEMGSGTNETASGYIWIFNPSGTDYTKVFYAFSYTDLVDDQCSVTGGGSRLSAADVDAIRLFMDSGNISTGNFRLYGMRA